MCNRPNAAHWENDATQVISSHIFQESTFFRGLHGDFSQFGSGSGRIRTSFAMRVEEKESTLNVSRNDLRAPRACPGIPD
jgi:hypothetical protein